MAIPTCTFCERNPGILLSANLDDGETNVVCGPDLMSYALTMAATLTQGMTPEQGQALGDLLDQIAANDPRPPKPPSGKSRKPKAAPAAPEQPAGAPGDPERVTVTLDEPCRQCGSETATGDTVKLTCDGCGAVLATRDDAGS